MKAIICTMGLTMMVGCSSVEEKQQHNQAQIQMVKMQRDAQRAERIAESEAKKELYRSLLGVAQADPSQAGVVAMALAMQGMQGGDSGQSTPIIGLQARQNEALQWAQALAPVAGGVISTVGTAIVSANVQKRQIEATRDVQINQATQTANAISAVAGLGSTAVASAGDTIGGDYYDLQDSTIDNSQTTTTSTVTTTSSVTNNDYSSVTYEGQEFSLPGLLSYLQGTGLAYALTIGDTVYTIDGEGEAQQINCNEPQFSPMPPSCYMGS